MDTKFCEISELMDDAALSWREVEDFEKERDFYFHILNHARSKVKELEEAALRSRPRCRCGSTTHRNPDALCCRLNKRVLAGRHGPGARDRALAETAALADPPTEV